MNNEELKKTYDEFHKVGVSSWFSDGKEERETILKMGEPWKELTVLEIGCGEGDLSNEIGVRGGFINGRDYSEIAIKRGRERFPNLNLAVRNYKDIEAQFSRIVMQGVLEHLDNPFTELKWMIDNLLVKGGDVITSSPCFLNPRGIVWMTLDMLGAVMSKTDLHYLHPWDFEDFCKKNNYLLGMQDCDKDWGNNKDMIRDLHKRIPLALKDGNLTAKKPVASLLEYLENYYVNSYGATMIYRIQT